MDSDWIWEALALGEESLLKDADIDYFDWNSSHEKYGTPLIALIVGKATGHEVYDFATGTPEKLTERLNLMRLVLQKGASPHAKPPPQFSICKSWWKTEGDKEVENSRTPLVHFNNKSAYGVVASCLEALTNVEGDWKREMRFLRDAAKILASYREYEKGRSDNKAPVEVVTIEMWEKILSSQEGADVTIACRSDRHSADDTHVEGDAHPSSSSTSVAGTEAPSAFEASLQDTDGSNVELKAHSLVLRHSSKVLRAMLSTSWNPSSDGLRIEVDCDPRAMKIILELIYVGEEVDEAEPIDVLLSALGQAHQWDVTHVVQLLEAAAARKVGEESLWRALEVACRLQLTNLQNTCTCFAKGNAAVKKRFKLNEYPTIVMAALAKTFGESEEFGDDRRCKRRRVNVAGGCRR